MTPEATDTGAFRAAIGLATEPDGPSEALTALVDTGATYTLVPAPILRRLGVEPIGRQTFHSPTAAASSGRSDGCWYGSTERSARPWWSSATTAPSRCSAR